MLAEKSLSQVSSLAAMASDSQNGTFAGSVCVNGRWQQGQLSFG